MRWRAVLVAFEGPKPRALAELYRAAGNDGWLRALSTTTCKVYAQVAEDSWSSFADTLTETQSTGLAVRSVVDQARVTALDSGDYPEAGLLPALAERALSRLILDRLGSESNPGHGLSPVAASKIWEQERGDRNGLAGQFLAEMFRMLTLHLVNRDGPQLVGSQIGGPAQVTAFAHEMAAQAAESAAVGVLVIERGGAEEWSSAVEAAWKATRDLLNIAAALPNDNRPMS